MRVLAGLSSCLFLLLALAGASPASAEPESQPVLITDVRVYDAGAGSAVFVTSAATAACGTTVFKFGLNSAAGQGLLSIAITALSARRSVVLEIASTGCTGWGTTLRSITLTTRPAT